eukprot:c52832_g1_i1.p1 GENE.c52832_g1_i1~~c52832_g1_i1.p1  ORF type:complete len:357 (-),score=78.84 c52832_g1_i1:102-1172(-)
MASELRHRQGGDDDEAPPRMTMAAGPQGENMSRADVMDVAKETAPPFLMPVIEKVSPLIAVVWTMVDVAGPYLEKVYDVIMHYYALALPYHPEEFLPILFGFVLCFFGSSFMLLIAAVEAFRITGYEKTSEAFKSLYDEYVDVRDASAADDLVDANADGVADVKQITKKQLLSRKISLAMRTLDPVKVMSGINGILAGMMAVVATLKLRLAKSITLGSTIGEVLSKFTERTVGPTLRHIIAEDYHKWIGPGVGYFCQCVGVFVAYSVAAIMSMWHSSIRGGQLFASGALGYMSRHGYVVPGGLVEGSPAYTGVTMALGGLGFYMQARHGLFFPLSFVLLPASLAEYILTWAVYLHN